jgi:hypothetical protein
VAFLSVAGGRDDLGHGRSYGRSRENLGKEEMD